MDNSELMSILNGSPYTNCFRYSGEDPLSRNAILRSSLQMAARQIHVLVVPTELSGFVQRVLWDTKQRVIRRTSPPVSSPLCGDHFSDKLIQLLRLQGTSEGELERCAAYFRFLCQVEAIIAGHSVSLTRELLDQYSGINAVMDALERLPPSLRTSYREKYAEVAPMAPPVEYFLSALDRLLQRTWVPFGQAGDVVLVNLPNELSGPQRKYLFQLLAWEAADRAAVITVLEGKKKYGEELYILLEQATGKVNLIAEDFFSGHQAGWEEYVSGFFDFHFYALHQKMTSCQKISDAFGQISVTKKSTSYDIDRRISGSTFLDRLLGNDRVEHYINHAPVWEPRYRPEQICRFPPGVMLVKKPEEDCFVSVI